MPVVIQGRTCKEKICQDLEEELRIIQKLKPNPKGRDLGGWLTERTRILKKLGQEPRRFSNNLEDLGQLPKTPPKPFCKAHENTEVIKAQ